MRSSDFKAERITLIPSPKEMLWYNYQTMCNTNMLKTAKGAKKTRPEEVERWPAA